MPDINEPEIKRGSYVVAVIRNTEGEICEGVVKVCNSRTLLIITPEGEKICERKHARHTAILSSNISFVESTREKLGLPT